MVFAVFVYAAIIALFQRFCFCDFISGSGASANGFINTQTDSEARPKPIWNSTYVDKLKHDLLSSYDKFARPAQHYNVTTVSMGMVLQHIEINEFKSTFTVYSLIKLKWFDEKLKWNSSNYGGLVDISVASHEVWQPDVMLYNSASSGTLGHPADTLSVVSENGEITWVPLTQLEALCEFNLLYWPFDTQVCNLKFGSWTYDGTEIDIKLLDSPMDMMHMISNGEWDLVSTNTSRNVIYYACCNEPYVDISFRFTLSRRAPIYRALIVTPAVAIIILMLMGFWLPPQAGEKVILNGFTSIIISIFMVYFVQKIPAMGSHAPLIILFYSSSLYMACFSMVISVVVIRMSRTQHKRPLPWAIKKPLRGGFGRVLCLGHYAEKNPVNSQPVANEEMRDHQATEFEEQINDDHQFMKLPTKTTIQQDWILFATAIDRISFLIYSLLFVVLTGMYSV